jgi:hypothetical protein
MQQERSTYTDQLKQYKSRSQNESSGPGSNLTQDRSPEYYI